MTGGAVTSQIVGGAREHRREREREIKGGSGRDEHRALVTRQRQ